MSKTRAGRGRRKRDTGDDEKETLAFKVLSQDATKELMEAEDVDKLQDKLIEVVKAADHVTDLATGAVLDYYVAALWWAREQTFTVDQTSAFYTVIHTLLENVKEKQMPLVDNMREFKKMLAGIGQDNSDHNGGLECFTPTQAKHITHYLHISLFQHYKLFEFMVSHTQAEEIIGTDLCVEVPLSAETPWPPPLEEGVQEEVYNEYIAPPPEDQTSEEAAEAEAAREEEEKRLAAEEAAVADSKVVDLLSKLTQEEVKNIMTQVFDDMLGGLKGDIANKLRDKENGFINRINKVHKVADK